MSINKRAELYIWLLLYSVHLIFTCEAARIIELSDRFLEYKDKDVWLVKFYAPWCNHCKRLEPVWSQVAQKLVNTDVRVARLDCNKYTSLAQHFRVGGFPTILYINKDKVVDYQGERLLSPILEFVRRVHGPSIKKFSNCEDMRKILDSGDRDNRQASFVLATHPEGHGEAGELVKNFTEHAEHMYAYNYFIDVPIHCVDESKDHSWIYVHKDGAFVPYNSEKYQLLDQFIISERFPAFQRITYANFRQILATRKMLVAAVLEENQIGRLDTMRMEEVRDMLEALAENTKELYHDKFLFGWFPSTEIPYSIAMTELRLPSVIVVDPETYKYYLSSSADDPEDIIKLLDAIDKADPLPPSFGGNTLPYRIYRSYFDVSQNLKNMYRSSPVLTFVIFLIPTAFFAAICYLTCCSDFLESSDEDEDELEEEDDDHEKTD
ncbi:protein disulfide-isomerase TMX3 [Galendromus occidentalis]|uniref:Protein disulfide-isomerase TMX3 n=1 Tax=Galendromus occidentalis TaxID=34638 RepID=A0AAJ7L4K9_9ACAR|nr:protein disulfide-isomerase TMX3 [Galendromus occidentalis]